MAKWVYFFIGVFIASVLTITVFMGMSFIAVEKIKDIIAYLFIVIVVLLIICAILALSKDRILEYFNVHVSAGAEDLVEAVAKTIGGAVNGDKQATQESSKELAKVAISWYSWTNFYRWVIRTSIALLITFTGFAGTALLVQQNTRIGQQTTAILNQNSLIEQQKKTLDKQNLILEKQKDIQMFSIATQLRAPFIEDKRVVGGPYLRDELIAGDCTILEKKQHVLYQAPSKGTVASLVHSIESSSLKEEMVQSLIVQLSDKHPSAALGALMALDHLGRVPKDQSVSFVRIQISSLELQSKVKIHFNRSRVSSFDCPTCDVEAVRSMLIDSRVASLRAHYSYISAVPPQNIGWAKANLFDFSVSTRGQHHDFSKLGALLRRGNVVEGVYQKVFNDEEEKTESSCVDVENFCKYNHLFFECAGFPAKEE